MKSTTSILTHPIWGNFGGMLQAYAMWRAAALCGKPTQIARYPLNSRPNLPKRIARAIACPIINRIRHFRLISGLATRRTAMPEYIRSAHVKRFKTLVNEAHIGKIAPSEDSAWIVGSDQVWRGEYARILKTLPFFFLDFVPEAARRRSISYAASFGTDEWEGTPEETEACRKLIRQFKAVSVREHSGVRICRDVFGVAAVQMPDPTFLLEGVDYQDIIDRENTYQRKDSYIAAYLLDESPAPSASLQAVSDTLKLPVQHLLPHPTAKYKRDRFPISVPQWLRYIKEAECVVTDSFHGCVFAIIFNKPFVCLGNKGRGSARFDTLLQTFGLKSRLVTNIEQSVSAMKEPIDWEKVNDIHDAERARGLAFLRENLS